MTVEGQEMVGTTTDPRNRRQRGIALTEFAIVGGLVFTLLFGIIEFGWVFYQYQDVRQGAREGARLVAVVDDTVTDENALLAQVCDRMEGGGTTTVELVSYGNALGSDADVVVRRRVDTITGYLDPFLGAFLDVESTVRFRVEQTKAWDSAGPRTCP